VKTKNQISGFIKINNMEVEKELKVTMKNYYPEHTGWFRVGELIQIKGSVFRVKSVKSTELRLKIVRKQDARNAG